MKKNILCVRAVAGSIMFCFITFILLIPLLYLLLHIFRFLIRRRTLNWITQTEKTRLGGHRPFIVGFFHPYCDAGGGGERVLWMAIKAIQTRYADVQCVVYTGDVDATRENILKKAISRFNIVLPRMSDIHFVFLNRRHWVEANRYPFFTLLGQSVGSLVLGLEGLLKCLPDVYIDSMGYAFTLPLFKYLGGCQVGCYVHYPTISTDMLKRVTQRVRSYNNASFISRSPALSGLKVIYYRLFAYVYGVAGKRSDVVMVNSSWTCGHIQDLWKTGSATHVIYPPCNVEEFLSISLTSHRTDSVQSIISIGQFRPEKDHQLQIAAFSKFVKNLSTDRAKLFRLVIVGSCRNEEDEARVKSLQTLAEELEVEDLVEFRLNVPFEELKLLMSEATVGLHTMWNEHFGIGIVECMAGGTIMLAHDSGGPQLDIVINYHDQKTGYLASDVDSYAESLNNIFSLSEDDKMAIRKNARESVARFSDREFEKRFLEVTQALFTRILT